MAFSHPYNPKRSFIYRFIFSPLKAGSAPKSGCFRLSNRMKSYNTKKFLYSHALQKDAIYLLNLGLKRLDNYFQSYERLSGAGFILQLGFITPKVLNTVN